MHPRRYFHGDFVWHYAGFVASLDEKGTMSRIDAHLRQDFWGRPMGNIVPAWLLFDEGRYFSCGDLRLFDEAPDLDHLSGIPKGNQPDFVCALFYVVLFDQVVYTHFSEIHREFQRKFPAPKLDLSMGWAGPVQMANPYLILKMFQPEKRGIPRHVMVARFERWAHYIPGAMGEFLVSNQIIGEHAYVEEHRHITPLDIVQAMIDDKDCTKGRYGAVFSRALDWWTERLHTRGRDLVQSWRPKPLPSRGPSWFPGRELVCECCGYAVNDGILWGGRVYAWDGEEVDLVAVPGWCEDCRALVPVEYTGDADRLVESILDLVEGPAEFRGARQVLVELGESEFESVKLLPWARESIMENVRRLRVIVERRGKEICLECGGRRITPIEADIHLELCWETGCYVGRKRTGFFHPGCGGEFIVRNAKAGRQVPKNRYGRYVYDLDGRLLEKTGIKIGG